MYVKICPSFWYQMAIFGVLAHGLILRASGHELGVKLRHVVHEIDWSVLFLLMFQIWYLRK